MEYNGKKYVVILEVSGGSDKGDDGHRKDTFPILNSIKNKLNFEGEVIYYDYYKSDEIFEYIKSIAGVVISRVNPGDCKFVDKYFQFLDSLSNEGIFVNTHPKVIKNINFKDILVELKDLDFSDNESYLYKDYDSFKEKFKLSLYKDKKRVLKQNYGSTGNGVWLVELMEDGKIMATEAVNNEKKVFDNFELFSLFFKDYYEKTNDDLVFFKGKLGFIDVKYLPRIIEGEIRVIIIGNKPYLIVHKKPKNGGFSATLFSGAKYESFSVDDIKWKKLIDIVYQNLPNIEKYLQGESFPLLWTMDFILDYDLNGNDKYILSEINSSCVGITTDLYLTENIADELGNILKNQQNTK